MGTRYTQNNFYITDDEALDSRQGPFNSVSEALDFIEHRYKGLSVYVLNSGSVVEYWFKNGIANEDLVVKSSSGISHGIASGTSSGTDNYTVSIPNVAEYNDGDSYLIRFTNGNTTSSTLNINSLGAKTLYRNNDGVLIGGDIVDGAEMLCVYNSTTNGFQVIGTAPNTLLAYVTNADSVTLTKGMPVYAFGGQGDRLTVKRAKNTGDSTSAQTIGLVLSASIGVNQKGLIMMRGLLDGLNILPTSTWADGDPVYLGATDGSITKIKPYAPNHLVYLGFVTSASNGSAGRLYVAVQNGYELQELHNVQAQSPSGNDTLYFNSGDSQWKTASIPTILGYTPVTNARTLTINGTTLDLSANRSWSVGDLLSSGSYSNPTWLTSLGWSKISGTPTTLSGYGISSTDTLFDTKYYSATNPSGYTSNVGTVTSVAALTIGTSGTDLSSTIATETTTPVITLNVPTASATNRGVLSSTDWSTFNGKQDTLTNPVTGTGTNNEIAAFNSTGSTITSLSTSTYPSLTELSYGKGVTSPIQTQFGLTTVAYTAPVASITSGGSAAETTIQTLTVPAGVFKSGDQILLTIWGSRTTGASSGVNSTLTTRITNISGATVIATVTGNRHHNYTITGRCLSDTSIIWWQNSPTTAAAITTVPSLASSGFTLNFSVTRDLNTSEFTLYNAICRKYN